MVFNELKLDYLNPQVACDFRCTENVMPRIIISGRRLSVLFWKCHPVNILMPALSEFHFRTNVMKFIYMNNEKTLRVRTHLEGLLMASWKKLMLY